MFEPNERIYNDKWKTEENKKISKKLNNLLEVKVPLHCQVPLSWAKEISDLIKLWEGQHGIVYTQEIYFNSYRVDFDLKSLKTLYYDLKNFFFNRKQPSKLTGNDWQKHAFKRSLKAPLVIIYRKIVGRFLNFKNKPTLYISQIKEKWGLLTVYYTVVNCTNPKYIEDMIEYDIKRVSEELIKKGVYYNE